MRVLPFSRRDPFWEADGPAARRMRRKQRFVALVAFVISLTAVAGAAGAWVAQVFLLGGIPVVPTIALGIG